MITLHLVVGLSNDNFFPLRASFRHKLSRIPGKRLGDNRSARPVLKLPGGGR